MDYMKDSIEIVDDIMDRAVQTDMWNTIQLSDPMIQDADKELTSCLDSLADNLSEQQIDAIRAAAWSLANAMEYSAILYGMRVAQAIQDVSSNPAALSQHILTRVAAARAHTH